VAPPRKVTRGRLVARVALALLLATLLHLSAWQALAGIRVSLARAEAPAPTIEAALLGPAPAPVALPRRRAMVRSASSSARRASAGASALPVAPLTAVHARTNAKPLPKPDADSAEGQQPQIQQPQPAPGKDEIAPQAAAPAAPVHEPSAAPTHEPSAAPETPPAVPATVAMAAPSAALPPRSPAQVVLPKSARLVYDSHGTVRLGGFSLQVTGRTTTQWRFADGHYQSDLSIDVVNFAQSSKGQFNPDVGLAPERYTETRRRNKVLAVDFDWANRHVTFTDGQVEQPTEPGAQDRLSIQYQLSVLRQIYPERFVRGAVVPVNMAGTRDLHLWTFTVTGEDSVDSGLGRLPALRIVSNRTSETGDESLEVWLCERLNWFPARIRMIDKNRNMFDFVLDEATIE